MCETTEKFNLRFYRICTSFPEIQHIFLGCFLLPSLSAHYGFQTKSGIVRRVYLLMPKSRSTFGGWKIACLKVVQN
jgi:hypothetical protein